MRLAKKVSPKSIDKNFDALKRRAEIKQRYGVFTQKMFEQLLEELRTRIHEDIKSELHSLDGKLDWLIGQYKKLDEEHTLITARVGGHEERIEDLEKRSALTVQ